MYQYFLKESIAFKLIELILFNEGRSVAFFTDTLHISKSTLYRLIHSIDDSLSKNFGIHLMNNPIQFDGSEEKIRVFYYTFFAERFYQTEWPHSNVDEQALDNLLIFVFNQMNVKLDYAAFSHYKLRAAINLLRYRSDNLVDDDTLHHNCLTLFNDFSKYLNVLRPIQSHLGIEINHSSLMQVFPCFFKENYALSYEQLETAAINNQSLSYSIQFLSKLIDELGDSELIDITIKEELIWKYQMRLLKPTKLHQHTFFMIDINGH